MASRGWGTSLALAVGVAAGTAAAQLGLAYGSGVIAWPTQTDTRGDAAWLASLAWIAWIAASCTVLGAVLADRLSAGDIGAAPPRRSTAGGLSRRILPGPVATSAWRLVIALAAAVGGLLTVPLVAIPARMARRADTYAPQLVAGGYAIVGVVIGLLLAIIALTARAIAANLLATAAWIWALAVTAGISGAAADSKTISTAPLAIWRFGGSHFVRSTFSWPGTALMLGAAFVIGALAAWPAQRRGEGRVGVAVSGAFGPLVVAAAYFLATPKLVGAQADEQLSAFLVAPYAVIAGLAGSVLLTAVGAQREERAALRTATAISAEPAPAPEPASAAPRQSDGGYDADADLASGSGYDHDLPADGYAPASAYSTGSLTASGTGETKTPLWPDTDTATDTKPAKGRKR